MIKNKNSSQKHHSLMYNLPTVGKEIIAQGDYWNHHNNCRWIIPNLLLIDANQL